MNSIGKLACSRLRHNRSTTVLTAVAIVLTTCLLMALGSGALGMVRANQQYMAQAGGNHHAAISRIEDEQIDILRHHLDVESLFVREYVATVSYDRVNASLIYNQQLREGINIAGLVAGRHPETANEIAGPPAFFQRMGAEPVIGGTVSIPYRVRGEGEILTDTFTITGLYEQVDTSVLDVSDTRLAYSAFVSPAFVERWAEDGGRKRIAYCRVAGEDVLSGAALEERIHAVAADAGVREEHVSLNDSYLFWMSGMDADMLAGVVGIALLIVVFCALILYSIYYVSIITNIQELGRLRALGASKGQIKRLLLGEGLLLAAVSIPVGLALGWLLARFGGGYIVGMLNQQAGMELGSMFSLPVTLLVVAVVLGTVLLSLLRPMRIAAKISPMEAIRYQEQGAGVAAERRGFDRVTLFGLSRANLSRNRRRSAVTVLALSMGCVLFLTVASVLTAMRAEYLAERALPKGDFLLEYDYAMDDRTYPENNLYNIQRENPLDAEMVEHIRAIPGVTAVERRLQVMADIEHEGYNREMQCITLTAISREDFDQVANDWTRGEADYDRLAQSGGAVLNWDYAFDYYGFTLGEDIPLTLYLGEEKTAWTTALQGVSNSPMGSDLLVPWEVLEPLLGDIDATTGLYVYAEPSAYGEVKAALGELLEEDIRLRRLSIDEELAIAKYSMQFVLLIAYAFLIILGAVSFLNLINTMITSIVTRRRELGLLQAVGLSDRQMRKMLSREGMVFTISALMVALTVGSGLGYLAFRWAKATGFMDVRIYRYPVIPALVMVAALVIGQCLITRLLGHLLRRDTIIERLRV